MSDSISPPDPAGGVADLVPLVRRVIALRVSDQSTVDDLVQETLARLVAVEGRLDPTALAPFAVVVARNLVRSLARTRERERRATPRMLDPSEPEDPEERALRDEDRLALVAALERLSGPERESLVAHDVEGVGTEALAQRFGTTPGALAVRLTRARARLRVEYLLALRRVELPTPVCKRVLLSLSSGVKRDQRAVRAGEHLAGCPTCAALSEPLIQRRRGLAVVWPFLGLDALARRLRRVARAHPAPATAVVVAGVVVGVWAFIAFTGRDAPEGTLFVEGGPPIALAGGDPLGPHAGRVVVARGAPVQSVPDARGFWLGPSAAERVWDDVHQQPEPPRLAVGQRVSFRGRVVANTPETLETAGRSSPADRAHLERQRHHVDVEGGTLRSTSQ